MGKHLEYVLCRGSRATRLKSGLGWLGQRASRSIDGFGTSRFDEHEPDARFGRIYVPPRRQATLRGVFPAIGVSEPRSSQQDFTHDSEVIEILAAMGVMAQHRPPPIDLVPRKRTFVISEIIPFGARIVFERIGCTLGSCEIDAEAGDDGRNKDGRKNYVRVLVK